MGFGGSGGGSGSIASSSDVSLSSPAASELLGYDAATQKWKNTYGGPERVLSNVQTGDYTATLSDEGKAIEIDSSSAQTVTIPVNIFSHGTLLEIVQVGTGQVTINGAGGSTFLPSGTIRTRAQGSSVALRRRASTNSWHVSGDLA